MQLAQRPFDLELQRPANSRPSIYYHSDDVIFMDARETAPKPEAYRNGLRHRAASLSKAISTGEFCCIDALLRNTTPVDHRPIPVAVAHAPGNTQVMQLFDGSRPRLAFSR